MENLEGNGPIVLQVLGEEDRRHAAAPQLALNTVAVAQGGLETIEDIGQTGSGRGRHEGYTRTETRARAGRDPSVAVARLPAAVLVEKVEHVSLPLVHPQIDEVVCVAGVRPYRGVDLEPLRFVESVHLGSQLLARCDRV